MLLSKNKKIILFILLLTGNNKSHSNDQDSKPIIRPSVKYLVFQPGSTFKLTCETSGSIRNVTWKWPVSQIPHGFNKTYTYAMTRWRGSRTNKRITVATLTVTDATYVHTGYYTCLDVQNKSIFSEQYVFIGGTFMQKIGIVFKCWYPTVMCINRCGHTFDSHFRPTV